MPNWNLYDTFRKKQIAGDSASVLDLDTLTLKCMVVTSGYTPNQNTHDFRDDLGATEVSGTNYTAGGNTLGSVTITMNGSGLVTVDSNDPAAWTAHASGFSNGRRAIIYVARGGASTADELIAYSDDFGADKGNVGGDFSIVLDAAGIFTGPR